MLHLFSLLVMVIMIITTVGTEPDMDVVTATLLALGGFHGTVCNFTVLVTVRVP
jgi:hypothetical protein